MRCSERDDGLPGSTRSPRYLGLVVAAVAGALGLLVAAPADAIRGHVFEKAFGSPGSGQAEFAKPAGVAVNEVTGNIYVVDKDNNRVEYFSAAGVYVGEFDGSGKLPIEKEAAPTGQFSAPVSIAVDNSCHVQKLFGGPCTAADPSNGDVYVVDSGNDVVDKFTPEGAYIGQLTKANAAGLPFTELLAVQADSEGNVMDGKLGNVSIYAEEGLTRGVDKFNHNVQNEPESATSAFVENHPNLNPFMALGCNGMYDVGYYGGRAEAEVQVAVFDADAPGNTPPLIAELDPAHSATGIASESATCDMYVDDGTSVGRLGPGVSSAEIERFGQPQLVSGTGVAVNFTGGDRVYVADASANVVDVFSLEPPGPPTISGAGVTAVTATSAKLKAEVNPRSESNEQATSYRFEYTTDEQFQREGFTGAVSVPGHLPPSYESVLVSLSAAGLRPSSVYHFRVVAENAISAESGTPIIGEEVTFVTEPAGVVGRLDGRVEELVSPAQKHGANITSFSKGERIIQSAASGNAITYLTTAPTEEEPEGFTNLMQVLSVRGAEGWKSQDIGIPHLEPTGQSVGEGPEYRWFSSTLCFAGVQPFAGFDPSLSAEASEQTSYVRGNCLHGEPPTPCFASCFRPLVVGCPPVGESCPLAVEEHANVPAGTNFGTKSKCPESVFFCGPAFEGATPDAHFVVLSSKVSLASPPVKSGLYEWTANDGTLQLISRLPKSEGGATAGVLGGPDVKARRASAISQDGTRVVWTSAAGGLYVRDTATGESVRLDLTRGGSGEGVAKPIFQAASDDDATILFTDTQQLTANSRASGEVPDLYECKMTFEAGEAACGLVDLTPANGGEAAGVQGAMLGTSEDASSVSFVARGVLALNHNAKNEAARAGADNLYAIRSGVTTFIAALSDEDGSDWGRASHEHTYGITARMSPNGAWIAFMSVRSLTGYDNRDAVSREPDQEVYLYNVEADRLVCASCNPTGARPEGARGGPGGIEALVLGGDGLWTGVSVAANLPVWSTPLYQPRYLSDSGRLFFNSHEALTPQDVNGNWDVYEHEPPEVGDCTSSSPAFSSQSAGCIALISSGTSPEESGFLDASENGDDAFFLTAAKIASQDRDTALDVYDATVCTESSPCFLEPATPPPPCTNAGSCRPEVTPQPEIFGPPSSQTFSGLGNLSPSTSAAPNKPLAKATARRCRRGFVRKHRKCVRRHHASSRISIHTGRAR
jgi:hypothetical protein